MIIVKTEAGQQVMKDRSIALSPRQRSAFILCDGKRTMDDVLAATATMGVTQEDLLHMIGLGLLAERPGAAPAQAGPAPAAAPVPASAAVAAGASTAVTGRSAQQRYQDAYPIATQLTASLGLRGFRLNLAVEAAGSFEQLAELAPRIKEAVGADKYAPLERALHG